MATYVRPPMPLDAAVWYNRTGLPEPGLVPDEVIPCSLSPLPLSGFPWLNFEESLRLAATHIIRTLPDLPIGDSYAYRTGGGPYPCTVFETPVGSGNYYAALFSHQVGAGFANHFTRVYVTRVPRSAPTTTPVFPGWI